MTTQPHDDMRTLETALAFYKQYTGYLENGAPADEPALECKKCSAYYFHDLGGKSLCADCLEALADHVDALQARIDRALSIEPYQGENKWSGLAFNAARDEFRAALTADTQGE